MQKQTTQLGRTVWGRDPVACNRPNHLVGGRGRNDHERQGWQDIKLKLRHRSYYTTRKLVSAATAAALLRAIHKHPQEVGQQDEDQGVQKQTSHLRQTVGAGDPAAEDAAHNHEGLGAREGGKGQKRNDLLREIHLVLYTYKFFFFRISGAPNTRPELFC